MNAISLKNNISFCLHNDNEEPKALKLAPSYVCILLGPTYHCLSNNKIPIHYLKNSLQICGFQSQKHIFEVI